MNIFDEFKSNYDSSKEEEFTLEEYLELCKTDPMAYATAAERMLKAIGEPEVVDTSTNDRLSRIFSNRTINVYPAFKDFFGMEDTIEQLVGYFKHSAQGLEEKKQVLYLLGPVGGGKSSLAEKLKELMEKFPIYTLKYEDEVSPVFETPLGLFDKDRYGEKLQDDYNIPSRYLGTIMSPWAVKRLKEDLDGDISKFKVVRLNPSKMEQTSIAKTEPGDENNQDISALVGKVDIRKLNKFSTNDTDCYSYSGGLCRGNQGMLEFVEMFKAPIKTLHPLLTATQEGNYTGTEEIGAIPFNGIVLAHCFSEDTEILTKTGWKGMDDIEEGDIIATLNRDTSEIQYQPALKKFVYDYIGDMYHMQSSTADHLVTPNHKMIYESYGSYKEVTADEFFVKGAKVPVSGMCEKTTSGLYDSENELRFHVWCVTDGSLRENGTTWRFHLKKDRKIERLTQLLEELSFEYKTSQSKTGSTHIYVYNVPSKFSKMLNETHMSLSPTETTILLKEWSHTDGSRFDTDEHFQLYTNVPFHRDLIQHLCVESGHKSTFSVGKKENYNDVYSMHIRLNTTNVRSDVINKGTVEYAGKVWCLETENHTLVARRNGKVLITGNSNDSEWQSFKNNKNNEAFLDRVYIVKVPYCLRVSDEKEIYKKLLNGSSLSEAPCAPRTLEMMAQMAVLSRLKEPENSKVFSKMRIYDGENLKDIDPSAKSIHEYKDFAGIDEGMNGLSTRFAYKVLSKVFNYDKEEVGANPVHLLRVLEDSIIKEQFDEEREKKLREYIDSHLKEEYAKFIEKELKISYLESYKEYGQNLFDRYIEYADHWLEDKDYKDSSTGEMYDRKALNNELEKIEKPAGISNPKDFRSEVVNFCLRYRADKGEGKNPKWTAYEKLKTVIEAKLFAATEDILPVISFGTKNSSDDEKKHEEFVSRMEEKGYTRKQTRLLVDWWQRVHKSS